MSTPAFAIGAPVEKEGAMLRFMMACAPSMSSALWPISSGER
jgi:hypothetical protein